MLDAYLPLPGVLFGVGFAQATALVLGARYGPHRLWSLAMFISCIALVLRAGIGEYGIPIIYGELPGFALTLTAVARASGVTLLNLSVGSNVGLVAKTQLALTLLTVLRFPNGYLSRSGLFTRAAVRFQGINVTPS